MNRRRKRFTPKRPTAGADLGGARRTTGSRFWPHVPGAPSGWTRNTWRVEPSAAVAGPRRSLSPASSISFAGRVDHILKEGSTWCETGLCLDNGPVCEIDARASVQSLVGTLRVNWIQAALLPSLFPDLECQNSLPGLEAGSRGPPVETAIGGPKKLFECGRIRRLILLKGSDERCHRVGGLLPSGR